MQYLSFLYLAYMSGIVFLRFICVEICTRISFFKRLNNIPLCCFVCVCLAHILFIHSSVGGCLGCLHLLAPVGNVAMNIRMQLFVQVPALG